MGDHEQDKGEKANTPFADYGSSPTGMAQVAVVGDK